MPRGGPDGGDGGRGGSVYLRVDAGQTTLRDFGFKHHFKATPGGRGSKARRHGKAGTDLYLDVPPGTAIYDDDSGELLGDLVAVGQETMVARGGRGGLGNTHFKTSTHQAPKHAQKGEPGDGALAAPGAPADRRHRARRAAERRQVDAAGGAHRGDPEDRRLPVHHARAEPRRHGPRRRGRAAADDRRRPGPDRGRQRRGGPRARVPAPRRADPRPRPRRGRLGRDPGWDFDVIREELRAHDPALLEKPMLIAFNKLDLPAAREAWPAFQRGTRAPTAWRSWRSPRRPARGSTRSRPVAEMLPDARGAGEPPDRRASWSTASRRCGDGFRVDSTRTACSGSAASGSSGSPRRRTSTSRSRPSDSSATCAGWASTPSCAGPGSGRRPRAHRGTELEWERDPGRTVTTAGGPIGLPGRPGSSAGRSTPSSRAPGGRRGGPRRPGSGARPVRPGRRAAAQARPADHGGEHRLAMVELAIADNPAFAVSRMELDRGGPSYTVDTSRRCQAGSRRASSDSSDRVRGAFVALPTWREPAGS